MNKKKTFFLSLLLCSFLGLCYPLVAACDPPGAAMAASKVTIVAISAKLTAMSAALIQTLKLHAAQLSAHMQALPAAFAKIATAQSQSFSQISQESEEARVIRDFTPSVAGCQNVTLSQQVSWAEEQKGAYQEKLNLAGHQQSHQASSSGASFKENVEKRYAWHNEKYCGEEDITVGVCKKKTLQADADILPGETLLNKKTLETREQRQAAFDLSKNLLNPLPAEPLNEHQIQTSAGKELWLKRKSREARQNLAQNIFSEIMADRHPVLDGKWMGEILSAQGQKLKLPSKLSRQEFMELEVKRRYENPQWYIDVQQMEPAELQRQLLHMVALLMKLMSDQNRYLEHLTSLQATSLSMNQEETPTSLPSQTLLTGGLK